MRVPRERNEEYDIEQKRYDYRYWKSDHPFEIFITQLENNLLDKYGQYHDRSRDSIRGIGLGHEDRREIPYLFHTFKFKKQVSTRVYMKGFNQVVIGTLWEFKFKPDVNKDIIQFALDIDDSSIYCN